MKRITLILSGLIMLISSAFGNNFNDIDATEWYYDWIESIEQLEITNGYPDGTYRPDNQLRRIELLSMTIKSLGYDVPVNNEYWGQNILDKAVELNVITDSVTDLMYTIPEGYVTREETARVIYNAYLKNNDKFDLDVQLRTQKRITDFDEVEGVYKDGVVGVMASGITTGYDDHTFKPKNHLTRAEASVFISRLALPSKRNQENIDVAYFEYDAESENSDDFKIEYLPENQDIINLLFLVDELENKDTSNGYADIKVNEDSYIIDIYSNQEDFDYSRTSDLDIYKRWSLRLSKVKPTSVTSDWIELVGYRNENQLEHLEVINTIFNYLFAEDTTRMWNEFVAVEAVAIEEDVSNSITTQSFRRNVEIIADEKLVKLLATKKTDALPIILSNDGKNLVISYTSTLSTGDEAIVQKEDATDKDSAL